MVAALLCVGAILYIEKLVLFGMDILVFMLRQRIGNQALCPHFQNTCIAVPDRKTSLCEFIYKQMPEYNGIYTCVYMSESMTLCMYMYVIIMPVT